MKEKAEGEQKAEEHVPMDSEQLKVSFDPAVLTSPSAPLPFIGGLLEDGIEGNVLRVDLCNMKIRPLEICRTKCSLW